MIESTTSSPVDVFLVNTSDTPFTAKDARFLTSPRIITVSPGLYITLSVENVKYMFPFMI